MAQSFAVTVVPDFKWWLNSDPICFQIERNLLEVVSVLTANVLQGHRVLFGKQLSRHSATYSAVDPCPDRFKNMFCRTQNLLECSLPFLIRHFAAKHCDLVVNVGSTMALDFSKCNKPALYINYDVIHAKNWSVKTVYAFQHFRSMKSLKPVFWINSKEEYKDVLNKVLTLNSNDNTLKDMSLWFKTLVNTDKKSSIEITKLLSA